jgi:hypothetical protein
MKIRQKIAMLLAAAMTLTAVPMVTMAKSDNSITRGIQIAKKDVVVDSGLKIELKDATPANFEFYVSLANAEFEAASEPVNALANGGNFAYTAVQGKKEMRVVVTGASVAGSTKDVIYIPFSAKLKGGDATIEVTSYDSPLTTMSPVVFARTSDSKAAVTVDDSEAIYGEAKKVAKITIEEPFKDVLKGKDIEFTVRHSDYEFVSGTVTGERGFSAYAGTVTPTTADKGVLKFTPPASIIGLGNPGRLVFEFTLKSTTKTPATGKVDIKVSGDNVSGSTVTVADVKAYGTVIEMDDKKVVDVVAGTKEEITFTIKETVAKTFIEDRDFDVVFENAFLSPMEDPDGTTAITEATIISAIDSALPAELTFVDLIKDKDDFVTGFSVTANTVETDGSETEYEIEDLEVYVPLGYTGDVTVTTSGRALGDDASTVAINAKAAIAVTAEPLTVKVGLKEQTGGKIVIKEADKGIIEQGEYIYLKLDSGKSALELKDEDFDKNDKIEVTSGDLVLDLGATKVENNILKIKVKRSSTEASTITIKDLKVYTDRTLPQGNFDLKVGGTAVAKDWTVSDATVKALTVKEFVIVGTPNTEDLSTNGLKKGTSSFVIGSSKYIVNGVEAEMDGAPYIDNGRTMVPVRYVANALGVPGTDIYFAAGTATVIAGSKTVSLTVGDKVAKLNGVAARTMVSAPVVKDGRTYVPVAEIGALLGVEAAWDSATQTATFTNK